MKTLLLKALVMKIQLRFTNFSNYLAAHSFWFLFYLFFLDELYLPLFSHLISQHLFALNFWGHQWRVIQWTSSKLRTTSKWKVKNIDPLKGVENKEQREEGWERDGRGTMGSLL